MRASNPASQLYPTSCIFPLIRRSHACRATTPQVYLRYAAPAGVCMSETDVLRCYRKAYNTPWGRSTIRYVGDGKPFW